MIFVDNRSTLAQLEPIHNRIEKSYSMNVPEELINAHVHTPYGVVETVLCHMARRNDDAVLARDTLHSLDAIPAQ